MGLPLIFCSALRGGVLARPYVEKPRPLAVPEIRKISAMLCNLLSASFVLLVKSFSKGLESVLKPSHCVKNDDVIEWEHEET